MRIAVVDRRSLLCDMLVEQRRKDLMRLLWLDVQEERREERRE